jgi:diguanylate cyclase (GGDEF)-like protein
MKYDHVWPGGVNHLMYFLALSSYSVFIAFSSMVLHKAPSLPLLLVSGALFVISLIADRRYPQTRKAQIFLLAFFHWSSHFSLSYPLYVLLVSRQLLQTKKLTQSVAIALAYAGVYTTIVISYSTHSMEDYVMVATDIWVFAILLIVIRYIARIHMEQQTLRQQNEQLVLRDPLTGLLNLQEFHRQLDAILVPGHTCVVCLIDCLDFKFINYEHGFERGSNVLQQVADYLQQSLQDVDLLARYAGDKFVLAIRTHNVEETLEQVQKVVHSGLKEHLDVEAIYASATFPFEGKTKETLMVRLDASLFDAKGNVWREREEMMLQSEKLKVVGEMAAGMAHEIRNPLTTIQGLLQISAKSDYNVGPWYPLIMQEIQRMSTLTGEFLQLSKPKGAHFEVTSLEQLIAKIIPLVEPSALQLGHQLSVHASESSILVSMDVTKMSQVILNIVKNAFEAMEQPGKVDVHLCTQGEFGVIEVTDTGIGMTESQISRLFRPFLTTKNDGTGLGLYICQAIVNSHGGHIIATSEANEGSQFRILLPRLPLQEGKQESGAATSPV